MDFPIHELMDEQSCYDKLVRALHPEGLRCPRCGSGDDVAVHRQHRKPVLDYRCKGCGRVFNAFTATTLEGMRRRPSVLILILRGVAQGVPTARLARELGLSRPHLLRLRHRLQERAAGNRDRTPLTDAVVEADEMYQNGGEKGRAAPRPGRSSASPGEQNQGPWHMGAGSPTGAGGGRTRERAGPIACAAPQHA